VRNMKKRAYIIIIFLILLITPVTVLSEELVIEKEWLQKIRDKEFIFYDVNLDSLLIKAYDKDGNENLISGSDLNNELLFAIFEQGNYVHITINEEVMDEYSAETSSGNFFYIILSIFFIILFIGFLKQRKASKATLGKRNQKNKNKSNTTNVVFEQIAGIDEVLEEVKDVVKYLKDSKLYKKFDATVPKGILLNGPPGNGKTMIAKALANSIEVNFYAVNGSSFVEKYVGVGAKRIRELFKEAKKNSPAIIFIDEIDVLGRKRDKEGSNQEYDQTLNQLLVEMDGFENNEEIIIIGATNRLDVLDEALLRPGRFERHIYVGIPDPKGRKKILEIYTKKKPLDEDVNFDEIIKRTYGFSGAQIKSLCNEAAINAINKEEKTIKMDHFLSAIDKIIAGLERKNFRLSENEKRITAYHEAGHALISHLEGMDKISKISILPRAKALGYVLHMPITEKQLYSEEELLKKIKAILAGRASEEVFLNHITTGAANDFEKATNFAIEMVMKYGMSNLGLLSYQQNNTSPNDMDKINQEANKILNQCYAEVKSMLFKHKDKIELLVSILLDEEVIESERFYSLNL